MLPSLNIEQKTYIVNLYINLSIQNFEGGLRILYFFLSGLKEPYAHAMQRVKIYMYHHVFLSSKSFTPIRLDLCMCNEESIFLSRSQL